MTGSGGHRPWKPCRPQLSYRAKSQSCSSHSMKVQCTATVGVQECSKVNRLVPVHDNDSENFMLPTHAYSKRRIATPFYWIIKTIDGSTWQAVNSSCESIYRATRHGLGLQPLMTCKLQLQKMIILFVCLGFNGTFSTNRLYRAIKIGK